MEEKADKPLFVLKPNFTNAMVPKVIGSIVFAAFISLVIFVPSSVLVTERRMSEFAFAMLVTLVFLGLVGIRIFWFYMNLKAREYRFYNDKLEFYEGWLTIVRHVVPYEKVTDVTMIKNVWDRFFNTATLGLITAGSSVHIQYVTEPEKVLNYLQKVVLKKK